MQSIFSYREALASSTMQKAGEERDRYPPPHLPPPPPPPPLPPMFRVCESLAPTCLSPSDHALCAICFCIRLQRGRVCSRSLFPLCFFPRELQPTNKADQLFDPAFDVGLCLQWYRSHGQPGGPLPCYYDPFGQMSVGPPRAVYIEASSFSPFFQLTCPNTATLSTSVLSVYEGPFEGCNR